MTENQEGLKKVGLARLAKAKSMSGGINSVDNESCSAGGDTSHLHGYQGSGEHNANSLDELEHSSPTVMSLPSGTGDQSHEQSEVFPCPENSWSRSNEATSGAEKKRRKSLLHSFSRSFRKKDDWLQLQVPKIMRSKSLTLISDAFAQVHNVCVLPAQTSGQEVEDISKAISESRTDLVGLDYTVNSSQTVSDRSDSAERLSLGESSEDCDAQSQENLNGLQEGFIQRWGSLDELQNSRKPLPVFSASEARQRNYLFGGLGSLLGPVELDRCFPNRAMTIFIATWNMNGKDPPSTLDDFLIPDEMELMPDMYVIGTQESGGDRFEWEVHLQTTIGPTHVLFTSAVLGILHLTIFLRRDFLWFCTIPEEDSHSLRPGTYFKTKGAVAIGFQFFGTRILFINSHLFAHEEKFAQRIQNYKNIVRGLDLPRILKMHHRHKDVTHRYDYVFWLGDLNFRLEADRDVVLERLKTNSPFHGKFYDLMTYDQLSRARKKHEAFQGFSEAEISFAPTFKFDPGTNHYDSSSKQRVPSYTDRILFKSSRDAIRCLKYNSCPNVKTSDHKPVWGIFECNIRPGKDE